MADATLVAVRRNMEVKRTPKPDPKKSDAKKPNSGHMPDHGPFKRKQTGTMRPFGGRSR